MASTVDLAPYVLTNVEGLEEAAKKIEEGHGAFGVVYKVTVNGLPCMAKRLHEILVKEVSKQERTTIEAKFVNECVLLSKLNHPNIVHFVGVCHGRVDGDLSLVMEKLHTDVSAFVKENANIPVSIKVSILLDMSYGLLYLHGQTPPIVHRDLTAPNILLTSDFRAKIADLGVSKVLVDPRVVTQTTAPGNASYMAPETKIQNPEYGTSVDIFAAGHLIIHVCIQDWPKLYKASDHLAVAPGMTEIEERRVALEEGMGRKHCLYPLAIQCLRDDPSCRPGTFELNKKLKNLSVQHPKTIKDLYQLHPHMADQELEESRHNVAVLTVGMDRQMEKIHQLTRQKDELLGELDAQRLAAQTFEEDFMQERKDRECAHSKSIEMEQRYIHQVQLLTEELGETNMKNDVLKRDRDALQGRLNMIEASGYDSSSSLANDQLRKENGVLQIELERCQEIVDSLQLQNTVLLSEKENYRPKSPLISSTSVPLPRGTSPIHDLRRQTTYPPETSSDAHQYTEVSRKYTEDSHQYTEVSRENTDFPVADQHKYDHQDRVRFHESESRFANNEQTGYGDRGIQPADQHEITSQSQDLRPYINLQDIVPDNRSSHLMTLPAYNRSESSAGRGRSYTVQDSSGPAVNPEITMSDTHSSDDRFQSSITNLTTSGPHSSHTPLKRVRSNPTPLPVIAENVPSYNLSPATHEPRQATNVEGPRQNISSPTLSPGNYLSRPDTALPVYENVKPVSTSPRSCSPVRSVTFKIGTSVSDSNLNSRSEFGNMPQFDLEDDESQTSSRPHFDMTVHSEQSLTFAPQIMEGGIAELKVTEPTSPLGSVGTAGSTESIDQLPPFDPYLVCPHCDEKFREGEIQRFATHANACRTKS